MRIALLQPLEMSGGRSISSLGTPGPRRRPIATPSIRLVGTDATEPTILGGGDVDTDHQ